MSVLDFELEKSLNANDHEKRINRENIPNKIDMIDSVGRFWSTESLLPRHRARLETLLTFCTDERLQKTIVPIIAVNSEISLRLLDWFVINYSKKYQIAILNTEGHLISVYSNYRSWLKFWRRDLFDAFRRGQRIYFELSGYVYSTTVAQLNFLYWANRTGVLQYTKNHMAQIQDDMNLRIAICKQEKNNIIKAGGKRKRSELSLPVFTKVSLYKLHSITKFV